MNKIIIFYEDTKESCRKFAQEFAAHENIQCRKASDYAKEPIIFASNARIGLIFESSSGKIPGDIAHIIQKLVADKTKDHMILVTGGGQELRTVRAAVSDMEQRGYHVANIYTKYFLQKTHLDIPDAAAQIFNDLQNRQPTPLPKEELKELSKKELRRRLRVELRQYRRF